MRSSGLLFGALAAVLVTLVSTTPRKLDQIFPLERSEVIYRLPTAVIPNHYDIELVPYFTDENPIFVGKVSIHINVTALTNVIIVHADELNINSSATTVYSLTDNSSVTIATQSSDQLRHLYILSFSANLPFGDYNVAFSFTGKFATDMYGFYRSSYQAGNETRWLVTTQFQPTAARRAFPCFDEPGLKATFNIRVAHFQDQIALSNMPNVSTSDPDNTIGGRVWTQFATTPVMSTYILAFIVSDFEKVSSTDEFFSIWSRSEAIGTTAWALEATQSMYTIFLRLVSVGDPWPKIDQVAVPDLSAGAMENWGLITYRERLLLWQAGESNTRSRERIANIISHEIAHIWFGNLVSPKWWDHLWFNEGFATFYQFLVPSLSNSTWRYAERIVTDQQRPAMIADSLETTRPMTNIVGNRSSILASFDNVAYAKSAAVLRMLNRIMREDLFSRALATFFSESAYGTFDPETLWEHMQAIADVNAAVQNHISIAAIMNSWVTQPGFPLVTVARNYSTQVALFSQKRYFMRPNSPTANPERQRWWIPITIATGNSPTRCNGAWIQPDWLRAQDENIMINGFANDTWLLANCQGIGFYRTNYDTRNWELLTDFLKGPNFTQINPMNRAILIDDSFNLARSGHIDYSIALNLSSYLVQETDFVVWRSVLPVFSYLSTILASHEYFPFWQAYQRSLISELYQTLGWVVAPVDNHQIRLHREQILSLACQLNETNARASAESQFNLWITNPQLHPIDPDLRSIVYCWGVRSASEETWDKMWNRFLNTSLATEGDLILQSLACSQNTTILEKYLRLSITPNSGIRSQDTLAVFTSILTSVQDNVDVLLDFVTHNTQAISEFYGGFNVVTTMLSGISGRITRQGQLEKLQDLIDSNKLDASGVTVERALLTANENLEWISNNAPVIQDWLESQGLIPDTANTENRGAAAFTTSLLFIFGFAAIASSDRLGPLNGAFC